MVRPCRLMPSPEFTEREYEILELIARHETNPEIAKRLHLSSKTVRNHVSNIFTKLQVADRAREAGLGSDTRWGRWRVLDPTPGQDYTHWRGLP